MFSSKILQKTPLFNCELYHDVFWVPVEILGSGTYTESEYRILADSTPERKKQSVRTLYDAIALFLASEFHYCLDGEHFQNEGIIWEFHKPGYYAVKINCGDCADCSSWFQYIIDGRYEESGRLYMIRDTGSGHIINYIKQEGWYYFVDFENYTDFLMNSICDQTGNRIDYLRSKYLTAVLMRSRKIESYVSFIKRYTRHIVTRYLFIVSSSRELYLISREENWDVSKYIYICTNRDNRFIETENGGLLYKIISPRIKVLKSYQRYVDSLEKRNDKNTSSI